MMRSMRRRHRVRSTMLMLATTLATSVSCDTPREPAVESARAGATRIAGTSAPVAHVDGDEKSELVFTRRVDGALDVQERATFGDDGTVTRRYAFDASGALASMIENREQTVFSGDRSPAKLRTEFIVRITASDTAADKRVDGAPATVQPFEIDNVRRRATAVYRLAPN